MHASTQASDWIRRWSHLVPPSGTVLDVACGTGRHLRWFQARGHAVTGVDASDAALAVCADVLAAGGTLVLADLERGPWPLPGQTFGAVAVTHYLWRPLLPMLVESLAPGGVLLYETFAQGQETIGRPSRADFLLAPGELLATCTSLHTVAFEDGFEPETPTQAARFVQRIAAVRPCPGTEPARYPLSARHTG